MIVLTSRCRLLFAFLILSSPPLLAQPEPSSKTDYRRYFKKPAKTREFWEALKFELDVGRPDLSAQHLRELLTQKPTPDDLVALHEKDGIAAFLRLRLVPVWSKDAPVNDRAKQDVELLITAVTEAVRTKLSDPKRIKLFVNNLFESPEEAAFARIELGKSGAVAIPYLVQELQTRPESEAPVLIRALSGREFKQETVPPLLAALDINNPRVRDNIIEILTRRDDYLRLADQGIYVAPFLYPLSTPLETSLAVRTRASQALRYLLSLPSVDQLPLAKVALTDEAERYYTHRIRFADPRQVPVWLWDGTKLIEDRKFTADRAEEYYGTRFAKQALAIDPSYVRAQIVLTSLVIDKGFTPATAEQPLGAMKPRVAELLAGLNLDLLLAVLDRALIDQRSPVILGVCRALGTLADPNALRPAGGREAALIRALWYGDRRVQIAAADAILRIPGSTSSQVTARIVDILARALSPMATTSAKKQALVAVAEEGYRNQISEALSQIGYKPIPVATGRQALHRLRQRADIDVILLDATLPDPGLPALLGQLRADQTYGRTPVLLAAIPSMERTRDLLAELDNLRLRVKVLTLETEAKQAMKDQQVSQDRLLTNALSGPDLVVLKEEQDRLNAVRQRILDLNDRYDLEVVRREGELQRFVEKMANVFVVPANVLNDARLLQTRLEASLQESGNPPLSPAERAGVEALALGWLASMAQGGLRGYDIRPVEDAILNVLQSPPVSDATLVNALRASSALPGAKVHRALATIVLNEMASLPARFEAAAALVLNIQQFGQPQPTQALALSNGLRGALANPRLAPELRERFGALQGALRPDAATNSLRLRGFSP